MQCMSDSKTWVLHQEGSQWWCRCFHHFHKRICLWIDQIKWRKSVSGKGFNSLQSNRREGSQSFGKYSRTGWSVRVWFIGREGGCLFKYWGTLFTKSHRSPPLLCGNLQTLKWKHSICYWVVFVNHSFCSFNSIHDWSLESSHQWKLILSVPSSLFYKIFYSSQPSPHSIPT